MDADTMIGLFKHGLGLLHVDEAGLADGNDIEVMDTVAMLCRAVKAMATGGDTLDVLHLYRLACLTEDLLVSPWINTPGIAKEWLIARGELLAVEIPHP